MPPPNRARMAGGGEGHRVELMNSTRRLLYHKRGRLCQLENHISSFLILHCAFIISHPISQISNPKFEIVLRPPTLQAGSQFRNSQLFSYALCSMRLACCQLLAVHCLLVSSYFSFNILLRHLHRVCPL